MDLTKIKELVSKIEAHDLQSFENDIMQYWHEIQKLDKSEK